MKEVSEQLTESVQSMRITCTVSETPLSEPGLVWQMDLQGNVFPPFAAHSMEVPFAMQQSLWFLGL